jgi:hypothetical protein
MVKPLPHFSKAAIDELNGRDRPLTKKQSWLLVIGLAILVALLSALIIW